MVSVCINFNRYVLNLERKSHDIKIYEDGTTRDRKPIKHKLIPGFTPLVGSTVKISITSINSADDFYANIHEMSARSGCGSFGEVKKKINELCKQYKPFDGVPGK